MFRNISWKEFLTLLAAALILYYGYAGFVLFRQWFNNQQLPRDKKRMWKPSVEGIKEIIRQPEPESAVIENGKTETFRNENRETAPIEDDDPISKSIGELGRDLDNIIHQVQVGADKAMVLEALRQSVQRYPDLNIPRIRHSLNNVIVGKMAADGDLALHISEVDSLWDAAPVHAIQTT